MPAEPFYPTRSGPAALRLSFGDVSERDTEEGIARVGRALQRLRIAPIAVAAGGYVASSVRFCTRDRYDRGVERHGLGRRSRRRACGRNHVYGPGRSATRWSAIGRRPVSRNHPQWPCRFTGRQERRRGSERTRRRALARRPLCDRQQRRRTAFERPQLARQFDRRRHVVGGRRSRVHAYGLSISLAGDLVLRRRRGRARPGQPQPNARLCLGRAAWRCAASLRSPPTGGSSSIAFRRS